MTGHKQCIAVLYLLTQIQNYGQKSKMIVKCGKIQTTINVYYIAQNLITMMAYMSASKKC